MDNVCHAIFLHDTHLLIDSHIPHGYLGCICGVWGVKLKQLWGCPRGICAQKCVWKSLFMRQNHAQHTFPAKNHRLDVVDTYQENRYPHLTYAPATHLRRGDVSKTTKYDFSSFTKGFPKIDKIGHKLRTSVGEPYPEKPAQNRLSKNVGRRGEPSDPAAWRCRMPSSGVVEAGFVRIGILGKPTPNL